MTTIAPYGDSLTLPESVRERYGLTTGVSVRIIETRDGILLIPLTGEPMPDELREEISEWQALGAQALEAFPYDELEP